MRLNVLAILQHMNLKTTTDEKPGILKGKIKFYNAEKGFGFIIPEDGSNDIFVHQTEIHADDF